MKTQLANFKLIAYIAVAGLMICLLLIGQGFSPAVVNWGLSHKGNGTTPTPPTGSTEMLTQHNGIFVGDESKKEVFLTFDLGYEAGYTADVLDVLKTHNAKAIFFLCGNYLKETDLVKRMISEGHIIGNHTNHHKDLPTLSYAAMSADIAQFTELFNEKFPGNEIKHFRPGKGRFNEAVLKEANEQGLKTVMWSNAIMDWQKTPIDAVKSADKILGRIHPGCICLFHISNSGMSKMLEILIPQVIEKGYTIGDATQL
ncbi:MAG: polysaccharide deacetylase family protein [Firmicutes bacterium]|nr:polysaccharide deacetylase family protein [Bacillota bacterium]